jgi:hypothetical protein
MYAIFERLARGRPSLTIVANGGSVTLDEVRMNLQQRRPMLVIEGSGRAADALLAAMRGVRRAAEDVRPLLPAVEALGVPDHRELFEPFAIGDGPDALAERLLARLTPIRSTRPGT